MRTKLKHVAPIWFATLSAPLMAHEGHGLGGSGHWHATDALGFVAGAAALGFVIWWSRRK